MALQLVESPAARISAATDVIVAVLAAGCAAYLSRIGRRHPWKTRVWTLVFALIGVSAALGAVSHGIKLSKATDELLWHPLYLALGLTVALFGACLIYDFRGENAARRALPILVALGVGFYVQRWIMSSSFLAFIIYEAVVMVIALVAYGVLAVRGRLQGAGLMCAGIAVTIAAAVIQASGSVTARLVWEFDHNGLFHLVQMPGLLLLAAGLKASLVSDGA